MRQSISLVLMVGGLSILGYCSFVRADTWIFQHCEGQAISRFHESASTPGPSAPEPSGLIGRIAIARLGLSAVITEGAEKTIATHSTSASDSRIQQMEKADLTGAVRPRNGSK